VPKLSLQTIRLDNGIETILPCVENGAPPRLPAKIAQAVKKLALYLPVRQQRATVESLFRANHMTAKADWNLKDLFTGNPC